MDQGSQPPRIPAFRPIEVHHTEQGAVLLDPLGLIEGQILIPKGMLPIVSLIDGKRDIGTIEASLREDGYELDDGLVAKVVQQLEEGLLLEGELFRNTLRATIDDFIAGDTRRATHAGSAGYPAEPEDCRSHLDELLAPLPAAEGPAPRGLIAPHIDIHRGAAGYRAAYRALAATEPTDLYVLFGTGHQGPSAPVTGLAQDWQTPAGLLRCDRAFVEAVHARLGQPAPLDLYLHRAEHSIELQALLLAHLFGDRDIQIAPFLCGTLPSATGDPDQEDYVTAILDAFRSAAAASGKRVCFLAGADLAHIGPFFDDPDPVDDARLAKLERDDRARLAELEAGRPGAFHRELIAPGNPDRICSATAIYLAASLAGGPLELLHYGQARAEDGSQCVSFCAARIP